MVAWLRGGVHVLAKSGASVRQVLVARVFSSALQTFFFLGCVLRVRLAHTFTRRSFVYRRKR